ncbi:pilus assembly FimT family protein [Dyella acidiphila]|uniref:Prepilin-type N-terminal cleavage/methylation domain-containing protein n=1 Tax=Dyella acidiphila TaxID=2775866 RepID=A0ABR9GCT8_9GAMM|nr:prepilin-type N-terminal cleavage/methylation domain-containing protein [Dyella acidiphila]MBE1161863.1 prepilin-type N-terminal cleavage/methylation domain-containing protein [Dyella acidiphila]
MHRQRMVSIRGLSLIELMVTLALLAFLVMVGLPLTSAWVQSAHQRDAAGMLTEGLGRAKALALRNPQGLTDQSLPVAVTCLSGRNLSVVAADASGADCSQSQQWGMQLPTDASIVQAPLLASASTTAAAAVAMQCVAFNERGIALSTSVGSLTCTSSSLNVLVGSQDAFNVQLP